MMMRAITLIETPCRAKEYIDDPIVALERQMADLSIMEMKPGSSQDPPMVCLFTYV